LEDGKKDEIAKQSVVTPALKRSRDEVKRLEKGLRQTKAELERVKEENEKLKHQVEKLKQELAAKRRHRSGLKKTSRRMFMWNAREPFQNFGLIPFSLLVQWG